MAKEKLEKTNAIRALDKAKLPYTVHTYESDGTAVDGIPVAQKTGLPVEKVYKTLVTVGHSREHYVFVIPVAAELDLKAAARSVGEKAVEMIHVADINKLTGYIVFSAGKIGMQIEMDPRALLEFIGAKTAVITAG